MKRAVSSGLGRASVLHTEGHGFDSHTVHHEEHLSRQSLRMPLEVLKLAVPVLEEAEKALTQKSYRDLVMTAQTNMFFQMGMENPDLMKAGFEAYNKAMAKFSADMADIVSKFKAGRYTIKQALQRFKTIAGVRYMELFQAGTMAIGNPYYKELGLTRKDKAFLAKARRAEMRYFRKFLHDIRKWHFF